jgi:channel protein (hemolysin III family)
MTTVETFSLLGFQDPINSWTHLLGSLAVCILLVRLFKPDGIGRRHPTPILVYGISCIFLLSMSGVYHLLTRDTPGRHVLRILDYAGIFILISGTLIAIHILLFSGLMKWGFVILVSAIAALGITFMTIFFDGMTDLMSHSIFIVYGWLGVVSIIGIWRLKKPLSNKYLIYGGIAYILGAVIDLIKFPIIIPGVLGAHEIFHFAVLIGVACHWAFFVRVIKVVDLLR